MSNNEKLVDKVDEIYKEIERSLIASAHRYKVPNPEEVVRAWLSQAFIIADRFDKGELQKKVQLHEGNSEVEDFDPAKHDSEEFIRSFKSYLKTSFKNDLTKQYHKRKRHNKYQTSQMHAPASYRTGAGTLDELLDAVHVSDIVKIIEVDISRLDTHQTSVLDIVNQKFLEAIQSHCEQLIAKYGNIVVVQNIDIEDNKLFFSKDFRDELETGVRKELCKIILEEENPLIIQKLNYLISEDKRGTLQKRLFRYFFEYHNGYPKRLRNRIKNKAFK